MKCTFCHIEIPAGAWSRGDATLLAPDAHRACAEKAASTPRANLKAIVALCENPHWTSDRRWRIRDLAAAALLVCP